MRKRQIGLIVILVVLIILTTLLGVTMYMRNQPDTLTANLTDVEWYDENQKEFTITTADELYDVATLSHFYNFAGQTIKLGADIVVNEGDAKEWSEKPPARKWFPIQKFAGTFDGQNHTISGLYGYSLDISMGLFADTMETCVIQNFKLVNSYFETKGELGTGSIVAYGGGTFKKIYSDAIINCDGGKAAGLFSYIIYDSLIEECWFDGSVSSTRRYSGGILDVNVGSKITIQHCLNTGSLYNTYNYRSCSVGGIAGATINSGTLTVDDCLSVGTFDTVNKIRVASFIGGGDDNTITNVTNSFASTESYSEAISSVISNLNGDAIQLPEEKLRGISGYQWTSLDFDKYWTTVTDNIPIPQHFADEIQSVEGVAKCFDTTWYDASTSEFTLTTTEQLYGMSYLSISTDYEGKIIKLGADIVFNRGEASKWGTEGPENSWTQIKQFAGTFDGQGHSISGLYINVGKDKVGLFGETTSTSIVKNLKITNSYMESSGGVVGSVAGRGKGRIDTIYSDAIIVSSVGAVGGIVGQANAEELLVTNCWFDGTVAMTTNNGSRGGGMIGFILNEDTKVTLDNCLFTGTIKCEREDGFSNVGGMLGLSLLGSNITMKDCFSNGEFKVAYAGGVGTIAGHIGEGTATITNTYGVQCKYPGIMYCAPEARVMGGAIVFPEERVTGYGGHQWTGLDFNKYWAVVLNDTPILRSFAKSAPSVAGYEKLFSTDWYDAKKATYTLNTVKDLYGFAILSTGTNFLDKTIKLGKDIVLNQGDAATWAENAPENVWTPIQTFAGTFDGQGHTISGVYVSNTTEKSGLFSETTPKATVKNLRLVNSYITSSTHIVGSIAGRGNGQFDTIYSDAILASNGVAVGGIVGQVQTGNSNMIRNCWFDGKINLKEDASCHAGGIVGFVLLEKTSLMIDNCLSTGNIASVRTSAASNVGGLCGTVDVNATLILTNSLHTGTFTVKNMVGVGTAIGRIGATSSVALKEVYGLVSNSTGICIWEKKPVGHVYKYEEKTLQGTSAYRMTDLDFTKYWMARDEKTPILQSFGNASEALTLTSVAKANTNWYDENKSVYTLLTVEDLYGFTKLSTATNFADKTIKLGANIVLNDGNATDWALATPKNTWTPIQTFAGTFDGQGHTISGVYVSNTTEKSGLFSETTPKATVKNLRLVNSYITSSTHIVGSIAGRGNGQFDTIYSDAILASNGVAVGGIVGQVQTGNGNSIRNCWFNGKINLKEDASCHAGGIVGFVLLEKTSLMIDNCLSTGNIASVRTSAASNVGGLCGTVDVNATLILTNSLHTGTFAVKNKVGVGTAIGRIGEATVNIAETYGIVGDYKGIGLGTTKSGAVALYPESNLKGYEGYRMTGLDFETYWVARKDKTPLLQSFVNGEATLKITDDIVRANTDWYDSSKSEYEISTVEEFYGFTKLSQTTNFEDKTIKLTADIHVNKLDTGETAKDLATKEVVNQWMPIGKATAFNGVFDGQGHTISGIYVNETSSELYVGLFAQTEVQGVIQNLNLTDSYVASNGIMTGGIVGFARGNIENIYSNAIVENTATKDTSNEYECGGIVGRYGSNSTATISNCWFDGTVSSNNRGVGGIVGRIAMGTKSLQNCLATNTVTSTVSGTGVWAGGLIGGIVPQTTVNATIEQCLNVATVNAAHFVGVGSVVGLIENNANTTATIRHTYATNQKLSNNNVMAIIGIGSKAVEGGTLLDKTAIEGAGAFQMTGLDYTTYWTAKTDAMPELTTFTSDNNCIATPKNQAYTGWYHGADGENVITTVADLRGFSKLSDTNEFSGETIKLGADITLNKGTLDPKGAKADWNKTIEDWSTWTPIGINNAFKGTFDGQGHTINGLYVNDTSSALYIGLFAQTEVQGVVQNLKVKNSYVSGNSVMVGSIVGFARGNITNVYSSAIVANTASLNTSNAYECGGIVGRYGSNSTATISNCWFDGAISSNNRGVGGIVGRIAMGTKTLSNCLATNTVTSTVSGTGVWAGGLIGGIVPQTTVNATIRECLNVATVNAAHFVGVGSVVGLVENTANTTATIRNTYAINQKLSNNGAMAIVGIGSKSVTGGTLLDKTAMEGAGAFQMKGLDFDNIWAVKAGNTPVLRDFTTEEGILPTPATQVYTGWYDGVAGTYTITTAAGLRGLSELSNSNNFYGSTINLGKDITLNEGTLDPKGKDSDWNTTLANWVKWTPIGIGTWFNGTFDGQGYTIRGVYVTDELANNQESRAGLFAKTLSSAKIQNLRVEDSYIQGGGYYVGSITGQSNGTQYHQVYSSAIVDGGSAMTGGLVGAVQSGGGSFTSCWYDGVMKLSDNGCQAGGIVGVVRNDTCTVTMNNCLNTGNIDSSLDRTDHWIGGLVGALRIGTPNVTIRNSLNVGTITVAGNETGGIGAIVGHVDAGTLDMDHTVYGVEGTYEALGSSKTGTTVTDKVDLVDKDNLLGENARTCATNLGWDEHWTTMEGETPILKYFKEEE